MRRLEPFRTAVEGTARPQIRGRLDVEHLVVPPQLGGPPLHAEIEGQGQEGGDEARDGEGGEGLVEAADHDARVVVPGDGRAAVAEGPAQVPGQQGEAEDPEDEESEVGGEVVARVQGQGQVEGGGCYEGDYGQEGDGEELCFAVSVRGFGILGKRKGKDMSRTRMKVQGM